MAIKKGGKVEKSKSCPVCNGKMIYNIEHMVKCRMNIPFCKKCGYSNKLDWTPVKPAKSKEVKIMRQTGRTTRMLLRAATFVSKKWQQDNKKIVTIVAHNEMAADRLQVQFCSMLRNPSRQQRGLLLYGNTRVAFMGKSRFYDPNRMLGIKEKEIIYFDHTVSMVAIRKGDK